MRPCLLAAGFAAYAACARPAPRAAGPAVVMITATDYAFGAPDTIAAGLTTLRMANVGREPHQAGLVRLDSGKTTADIVTGMRAVNAGPHLHEVMGLARAPGKSLTDVQAWAAGGMKGAPPARPLGGIVALSKGEQATFTVTLAPGNYLLACFVPDAKDGKPHLM